VSTGHDPAPAPRLAGESASAARFPGFDVTAQARHWDRVTAGVVLARLRAPEPPRYFTGREEALADALFDLLLDQPADPRVPVTALIDGRLAEQRTDGWRYADMPEDGPAWKRTLGLLDEDARDEFGSGFAECNPDQQREIIQHVQDLGSGQWHELPASRVWSLWTRYACTAFYSHPAAWNEIGFPGPAYPRGYGALGVDKLEAFEVRDARPADDPMATGES
jgi:hypothetical protein